jgi:hypothetical protein
MESPGLSDTIQNDYMFLLNKVTIVIFKICEFTKAQGT